MQLKQVLANGKKRALSVGAANIFTKEVWNNTTAPGKQLLPKIKEKIGFQKYCFTEKEILFIGTIPSQEYSKKDGIEAKPYEKKKENIGGWIRITWICLTVLPYIVWFFLFTIYWLYTCTSLGWNRTPVCRPRYFWTYHILTLPQSFPAFVASDDREQ